MSTLTERQFCTNWRMWDYAVTFCRPLFPCIVSLQLLEHVNTTPSLIFLLILRNILPLKSLSFSSRWEFSWLSFLSIFRPIRNITEHFINFMLHVMVMLFTLYYHLFIYFSLEETCVWRLYNTNIMYNLMKL